MRQPLGYLRYDTPAAADAINEIYVDLDLFQNLFQPSIKLIKTVRRGSKVNRIFDNPTTPLDRLLRSKRGIRRKARELQVLRERLDPFDMSREIDVKLERIYSMSSEFRKLSVPGKGAAVRKINPAFVEGMPELGEHLGGPFVDSPLAPYAERHYRDGLFQTR